MPKPIIGITGPVRGGAAAWFFTSLAVRWAGGHPVRITPNRKIDFDGLQGLILGGGADVHPKLYGEDRMIMTPPPKPRGEPISIYTLNLCMLPITWISRKISQVVVNSRIDSARDELEYSLLEYAFKKKIPVLGICRGEQLLNVFCGGTLYQGLQSFYVEEPEIRTFFPKKKIKIVSGTILSRLLGEGTKHVNGLHLQGVHALGASLQACAHDRNGIIQAIEHREAPFIVGVQWHPEYLLQLAGQRQIFKALVEHCPSN